MPDPIEPVDRYQIESILRAAFGEMEAIASVSPLGGGSINTTFQVELRDGPGIVLRIAPSDAAAAAGPGWLTPWGLRREAAVIVLATPALGDLLPTTIASDFDRTLIDRDWVIQEQIPGVPLSMVDATLATVDRAALWTELGTLIHRLHETPGAWFGPPTAGPRFERLSALLLHDADGLVDDAARFGLPDSPFRRLRSRIDELVDMLDDNPGPRLVHSDLVPAHIFVDRDTGGAPRVRGIIDLEFGRFADARFEGTIADSERQGESDEARQALVAGYGRSFHTPEDRQRQRIGVALGLAWSATLLSFQGRREDVPAVIERMEAALQR